MKKRCICLLVLALLLSACSGKPENTEPTAAPTEPTSAPTEPGPDSPYPQFPGYEYASAAEIQTSGAVGVYRLEGDGYYAVRPMGDGVVLFSGEGETTLTYLSEAGRHTCVLTGCFIYPDGAAVQVTDSGLGYYDTTDQTLVYLDTTLQETARISLPQDLTGPLVLSSDLAYVYYFNETSLRCLELQSGISRLLKECGFTAQEVKALHFDGALLECCVTDGDVEQTMYVSTETGEMVYMGQEFPTLCTASDTYFAQWFDGYEMRNIFGDRTGASQCLVPAWEGLGLVPMPLRQGAAVYDSDAAGSTVEYYDLTTGTREASVTLNGVWMPNSLVEDPQRGLIWFLGGDAADVTNTLYCWDTALSPTGDTASYVQPHYTDEQPDTEGLETCAKAAQALAQKYHIKIRIGDDALNVTPEDYTFAQEYRVPVYEEYLAILEEALSVYPENFFKTLGKNSDNDYLTVSLVRSVWGNTELGSLAQADGVHFWNEGSAYVTLAMGESFEQTFHHELFHAIDSYVLTETRAYDFWDDLNPKGFKYDYSYIANQGREDGQYLDGKNRAFIDLYAMSFPKEDRARIMEYAIMSGNESYFESETMQAKLKTLCDGIREAFGLSGTYLWEQYLK